jgi:hypothetical protein
LAALEVEKKVRNVVRNMRKEHHQADAGGEKNQTTCFRTGKKKMPRICFRKTYYNMMIHTVTRSACRRLSNPVVVFSMDGMVLRSVSPKRL